VGGLEDAEHPTEQDFFFSVPALSQRLCRVCTQRIRGFQVKHHCDPFSITKRTAHVATVLARLLRLKLQQKEHKYTVNKTIQQVGLPDDHPL
jgi:hypothetical protein